LDPHNVADRLTPLLPFKQLCLMQHFLNEGNSFQKLVSRNELNQLKKDAKYSTSFRQFYVMWKREVTCESLHRLAPVYFISCCVCVCIEMSAASVFNSVLVSHLILDINLLCIVPSTYLVLITSCVSGYVTETNFRGSS